MLNNTANFPDDRQNKHSSRSEISYLRYTLASNRGRLSRCLGSRALKSAFCALSPCHLVALSSVILLLLATTATAAPKTTTQIPSIQAPAQPVPPPSVAQPAQTPLQNQAPGPVAVPVMVPVATTQRELPPDVQRNIRLLTGQNSLEARQIGALALLDQGSAAISALRQILTSQPTPIVVQAIAEAISDPKIKDPPAELAEPLIQQLAADDSALRSAVITALVCYHDHDMPTRLRPVFANPQTTQQTRLAAVAVLSQLADRDSIETLIDLLKTQDDVVCQAAVNALNQLTGADYGTDAARWLTWWQTNRNRPPREWTRAVITSLREEHHAAVEEARSLRAQLAKAQREIYYLSPELDRPKRIITCLTHPVPDVRLVGVDLVNMLIPTMDRKSIPPEVTDQLRKLVNDPDPQVRLQTVRVLGDLRNSDDAKLLLAALATETDPAISQAITRALGLLHNDAAVPVLLEKLNKGDSPLAAAAAAGLSVLCQKGDRTASPQQLDQVVAALNARMDTAADKTLRQAILDAMARIADNRFREQFLMALRGQDPALRQSAVKAFADLNDPDDPEKVLAPQLDDPEAVVREAVCTALGKVGKSSQLPLLLQRCDEQAEPNLAVRRAAEDATIAIMLRMDRPALRTQLEHLIATPEQAIMLAGVLEKALTQAGQNPDALLQAVLLRALATARLAEGKKEEAAGLWLKVVLIDSADDAAISTLAHTLVELARPDQLTAAIQQVAANQSAALPSLLTALTQELKDAAHPADMAAALRRIDTAAWSPPNQQAFRHLLKTCAPGAPASAPATMATHH